MLKRSVFKKISIFVAALIVVAIINIFPDKSVTHEVVNNDTGGIIYLLNKDGFVSRLNIFYNATNDKDLVDEIIEILTENSESVYKLRDNFYPVIPRGTKILSIKMKDKDLTINFSKEILNVDKDIEEKMIEAILYSITANLNIENLYIQVEGESLTTLPNSSKPLPSPITRAFKINKVYDLDSFDNIKITTIFYLARDNDFIYHIPVTKYSNTEKEKVEIIIDELKSSSIYGTNMLNYIHEETELINFEILDNSMLLNFNDKIFADISTDTLIEEVTYSINLSLKENYDVETVMYYIDDNIISNYFLLRG